jgi:hypothetical protein
MSTPATINSQNPFRINCLVSLLFTVGDIMFCGSFSWLSALQGGGRVNFWSSKVYVSRGKNAIPSSLYNFEQGWDLDIASANRYDRKAFFPTFAFSLKNLRPIVLSLAKAFSAYSVYRLQWLNGANVFKIGSYIKERETILIILTYQNTVSKLKTENYGLM